MLFLANFDPLLLSHFVIHPGTPQSTPHISDPPILIGLVRKTWTKFLCTNSLSIVRLGFYPGVLSGGLLSGRFSLGWLLSVPPSVKIHLLQQKVKYHFKFQVLYVDKKIYKCDVTCSCPPLLCHKLSHLFGPPPPRA